MRATIRNQLSFGEIDISQIKLCPKSRDDIPRLLRGIQYMYVHDGLKKEIFEILEKEVTPTINKKNGRPGMDLWKILVMGVLRLNLNWDYDRLCEMVNHHETIRQFLGHGYFDKDPYQLQTIKDNIKLLTPDILDKINEVVVRYGHKLVKKKGRKT